MFFFIVLLSFSGVLGALYIHNTLAHSLICSMCGIMLLYAVLLLYKNSRIWKIRECACAGLYYCLSMYSITHNISKHIRFVRTNIFGAMTASEREKKKPNNSSSGLHTFNPIRLMLLNINLYTCVPQIHNRSIMTNWNCT